RELHDTHRRLQRPAEPAALDRKQRGDHAQRRGRAVLARAGGVKIAIVTDAWRPQTNGVVQTLSTTAQTLRAGGDEVLVIEPNPFRTFPCPTYPEIRLAWFPSRHLAKQLHELEPASTHSA